MLHAHLRISLLIPMALYPRACEPSSRIAKANDKCFFQNIIQNSVLQLDLRFQNTVPAS
jgi:hypothetical protein